MKKRLCFLHTLVAVVFALSGCASTKQTPSSNSSKLISVLGAYSSDIENELEKHKKHSHDQFELSISGSSSSNYSLIVHCDGHDTQKECVFYKIGVYKSDISSLIEKHADHGDDTVVLASGNSSQSYGAIVICKH